MQHSFFLVSKKTTLYAFFVHFFVVVLHDYNVKLPVPETSQLHVLWRKCCMCSCSHFFFFAAAYLHIGGSQHFPFFSLLLLTYVFLPPKLVSFGFYLSLQLFLCYPSQCASVDIKIKLKERIGFGIVVFYLYKFGQLCYLLPKQVGANFHPSLHEGADINTDDFVRTKISWMH